MIYNISNQEFAMRIMNLNEIKLLQNIDKICENIYQQYLIFNYLRIINSKVKSIDDFRNNWLKNFCFKENEFIKFDYKHNYMLSKNIYENQIFYCNKKKIKKGGRIFVHSVLDIENEILKYKNGKELLEKYESKGISYEIEYSNISLKEKFNTNDIKQALEICKKDKNIDYAYIKNNNDFDILVIRIILPGYIYSKDSKYIRPPIINNFIKFTFGPDKFNNYEELSQNDIKIFISAFSNTRQGIEWQEKDFIIMNNITHYYSTEKYDGELELFIFNSNKINIFEKYNEIDINNIKLNPLPPHGLSNNKIINGCCDWGFDENIEEENIKLWNTYFSMIAFDCKGNIDKEKITIIKSEAKKYGHIHVYNTNLYDENIDNFKKNIDKLVKNLNFTKKTTYPYGGSKSGRTPRVSISKKTKSVDKYPSELFLLPHNEILYQHAFPIQLFFSAMIPSKYGGRTFSHSSLLFEKILKKNSYGLKLFNIIIKKGYTIKTGFVSKYEPDKNKNFYVSWEDRFKVPNRERKKNLIEILKGFNKLKNKNYTLKKFIDEKLQKYSKLFPVYFENCSKKEKKNRIENMLLAKHILCWRVIDKFDKCEWKKNIKTGYPYLYTIINISSYKTDFLDKNIKYLLFPRIKLTAPDFINGYRDYTIGNYKLTSDDISLLLKSFWLSREGLIYNPGDFQIINNIKYAHSRESYKDYASKEKKRKIVVAMGGTFFTDKLIKDNKKYILKILNKYPEKNIYNEPTIYKPVDPKPPFPLSVAPNSASLSTILTENGERSGAQIWK